MTLPKEIEEAIRNLVRDADSEFAGGSQAALEAAIVAYAEEARREERARADRVIDTMKPADLECGCTHAFRDAAILCAVRKRIRATPSPVEGDAAKTQRATVPEPQIHPQPPFPALGKRAASPSPVEGDGARAGLLPEIAAFARVMDAKVKGHNLDRGEYGWRTASPARLMEWLDRYVEALRDAVTLPSLARDPAKVTSKAANIANLAMMIADVAGDLDAAAPSEPESGGTRGLCPVPICHAGMLRDGVGRHEVSCPVCDGVLTVDQYRAIAEAHRPAPSEPESGGTTEAPKTTTHERSES